MKNALKDDTLAQMEKIACILKKAGKLYLSSRGRSGIHEFLRSTYAIYWVLKRRGKISRQKRLLRTAAGVSANPSRRLSDLILTIAAKDCDRRDRHRWKKFIEAAFQRRIHPKTLIDELQALRGVNNALAQWVDPTRNADELPGQVVISNDEISDTARP